MGTTKGNTTDDLQGSRQINHAAPVWSPNLHDTNYRKIQYTQNEDCYGMSQDVQYRSPTHRSRNAESYGTLRVTVCTVLGQMSGTRK